MVHRGAFAGQDITSWPNTRKAAAVVVITVLQASYSGELIGASAVSLANSARIP